MSEENPKENIAIEFDPILPESGVLFFEECSSECEIDRPIILPLKSSTQLRFEQLQIEAGRVWKEKEKQKSKKNK